jgi:hypothetical protein
VGLGTIGLVFLLLMRYQWSTDRGAFYATWGTLVGSLVVEAIYRGVTKRSIVARN